MLAVKRTLKPLDMIYKRPNHHHPAAHSYCIFADISLNEHHPDIYNSLLNVCLEKHLGIISDQCRAGLDLVGVARR
jgi:hypothetical protein